MPYFSLAIFLLAVAVLWSATLIFFMARHLLAPRRMTDVRALVRVNRMTPTDLGLAFTPMVFNVRDTRTTRTLRLAAWWIPAAGPSDKTVLIVHGYGDAKVGGIAWTPAWHALGWHVLAVDLRAHGESEGARSTAGFFERDDLDQILNAIRVEKPDATRSVALFGVSLGAACVAACAVRRGDLAAVVLESPYVDYRQAVRVHVRRSGFPLVGCTEAICRLAEWMSGADFRDVRPVDLIPVIPAPLLVIVGDADPMTDAPALAAAVDRRPANAVSRCDVIPDVPHVMALAKDPDGYQNRLANFLDRALFFTPTSAGPDPSA